MAGAEHALAGGSIMFTAMISLEPATITNRSYPPAVSNRRDSLRQATRRRPASARLGDGPQRPVRAPSGPRHHAAVLLRTSDPALGPVAFPRRASAAEIPQAPIGHHWQDSTHIADNVATVAVRHKWLRVEASGFYGSEPDENRWNIDWGGMNSYSARVSVAPTQSWMAQVSAGRLTKPERREQGDVVGTTASVSYTRGGWSSSLIWGRNHQTFTRHALNSVLSGELRAVAPEEFFHRPCRGGGQGRTLRARDLSRLHPGYRNLQRRQTGRGANICAYRIPPALQTAHSQHPYGVNVYLRPQLK